MLFLLVLAALLLPLTLCQGGAEPSVTVFSTTLITITSCHPTVTDCPGRNQPLPSSSIASLPPALQSSSINSPCVSARCNADNCLRAFERGQGQQFCSSFTQSVCTDPAALPSYATQCTGSSISRVSSACSCLNNPCTTDYSTSSKAPVPGCNADNCLRAMERSQAQQFCHTFTQSMVTSTSGLPMWASQCTGSTIPRVSSACSCLGGNKPASQSVSSASSSVNTFTSQAASSSSVASAESQSQTAIATVSVSSLAAQSSHSVAQSSHSVAQSSHSVAQSSQLVASVGSTLALSSAVPSTRPVQSTAAGSAQSSSESLEIFSFTTTGTDSQGSPFSSIIVATLTPSLSAISSAAPSKPPQSSAEVFSFTTTGTNAQGSSFSSVIVATLTPSLSAVSSAAPSQPAQSSVDVFSFTTTGTDAQGSSFSSIIVATVAPSSSGISSAAPSILPFSFTSTGTDSQGNSFTTVIQGTLTPSGVVVPFTSLEIDDARLHRRRPRQSRQRGDTVGDPPRRRCGDHGRFHQRGRADGRGSGEAQPPA